MASYFVKYNDVDLTDIIRVRTVETTVLPPRENNSITIWERPGSIYNSYRYGEREIVVTFLIRANSSEWTNNPDIMESKLNTLRNVFKAPEPKPLYLGTQSRFIYAVPEGDFKMTELRYDCYECEITFVCHNPEFYSTEIYDYNNTDSNNFEVNNGGNTSTYPIINIGINTDNTSFVQVENAANGNKLLIGGYPTASSPATVTNYIMFRDPMEDPSTWEAETEYIDPDRYGGNPLETTGARDALTLTTQGAFVNNPTGCTWTGTSAIRRITPNYNNFPFTDGYPDNFIVQAQINFTSTGTNGDPSKPSLKEEGANEETVSGDRVLKYFVDAVSLNARNTPSFDGEILYVLKRGTVLKNPTVENGWVKFYYNGIVCYCPEHAISKMYFDSTTKTYHTDDGSYTIKNVVVSTKTELRSAPTTDSSKSTILATIPAGTSIRINDTDVDGFYKLNVAYNGKIGYVNASKVTEYEGVGIGVEYPQDEVIESSDDQMGICEVYGWSLDGTKLFKMSLADDNEYYNYVKPAIEVGSTIVLQDNTSVPKQNTSSNNNSLITDDSLANGSENSWNDFFGELGIQRKNGKWKAWIYKMKNGTSVKKLELKEQAVSGSPDKQLAFVTIYMGIKDHETRCSMSISDVKVTGLVNSNSTGTKAQFMKGDVIKVDCHNNKVYLNDKIFNDISIGSNFIELVNGINNVKLTSDDPNAVMSIMFNERYV